MALTQEEFLEKIFGLLKDNLEVYSAYVEDIKRKVEDYDLFNLFAFRDEIAAILYASPVFPIAKELGKEENIKSIVSRLREVDLSLAKESEYLMRVIDFKKWRKKLPFNPPFFAWWYFIDKLNKDMLVPQKFPSSLPLYGLGVKGIVNNRKCQILLIAPDVPVEIMKKYQFIRKFFTELRENISIDLPQIFMDNNTGKTSLLLPSTAFWGEFKKLASFDPYISETYLAVPKINSNVFNSFLEEFVKKIKNGEEKIFSHKTLTADEFVFVPVALVKKTTIKISVSFDFQRKFEEVSRKYSYIPQEVAVAV